MPSSSIKLLLINLLLNFSSSSQISFSQLLGIDGNTNVFDAHLTLLEKKSRLESTIVDVCPMEVKAFIINR